MTKQLDILTSETKNVTASSTSGNKEVKEEASLFDKLLGGTVKNSSSEKADLSLSSASTKKEEVNNSTTTQNIPKVNNDKDSMSQKSSSLLDRLILETKKDVVKNTQTSQVSQTSQTVQQGTSESNIKSLKPSETNIKTELQTNETVKIVDNKEEIKNSDVVKKEEVKNLETPRINQQKEQSTSIPTTQTTKDSNETVKIVDNKEEIKNSDVVKKEEVKNLEIPKINQQTQQSTSISTTQTLQAQEILETVKVSQVNIEENETNIKTELKTNETIKTIETSQIVQQTQTPEQLKSTLTTLTTQVQQSTDEIKLSQTSMDSEEINIKPELKINENNNTKLGKDLASLNKENIVNEKINISKDEVESLPIKQKEEPKTLMDSLIEKTKTLKNQISLNDEESKTLKNTNTINNSKDVISNIYLSSQKNNINNSALSNKTEAINSVKNATTTEEVEVNAKKLDLNLKDISLETKAAEVKKDTINLIDRKNSLDKIILNNNARHNEVTNLITKSVEASKVIMEDSVDVENEVSLTVNPVLAHNIQTKIIGARQQMSSMMSEVARQMYENYKPPITSFRINLTPGALGNIAIVMKNDKDSGLNISLNISNTSTLDAFVDSQNSLRNALNKTFEEGTEFNLDFSSSEQNNNKSDEKEDTNHAFSNQSDTQSILESREKNLESEDRNLDYM